MALAGPHILAITATFGAQGDRFYALYQLNANHLAWTRADGFFTGQGLNARSIQVVGATFIVSVPTKASTTSGNVRSTNGRAGRIGGLLQPASGSVPGWRLWRSIDGGANWTDVAMSYTHPSSLTFARAGDGATYYGVGIDEGHGDLIYSADSGATWRSLTSQSTVKDGAGKPLQVGGGLQIAVAPDGTAFAPEVYSQRAGNSAGSGVFRLAPNATGAVWRPFVYGETVSAWHAVVTPAGATRLWGLSGVPDQGGQLVYADVPASA